MSVWLPRTQTPPVTAFKSSSLLDCLHSYPYDLHRQKLPVPRPTLSAVALELDTVYGKLPWWEGPCPDAAGQSRTQTGRQGPRDCSQHCFTRRMSFLYAQGRQQHATEGAAHCSGTEPALLSAGQACRALRRAAAGRARRPCAAASAAQPRRPAARPSLRPQTPPPATPPPPACDRIGKFCPAGGAQVEILHHLSRAGTWWPCRTMRDSMQPPHSSSSSCNMDGGSVLRRTCAGDSHTWPSSTIKAKTYITGHIAKEQGRDKRGIQRGQHVAADSQTTCYPSRTGVRLPAEQRQGPRNTLPKSST